MDQKQALHFYLRRLRDALVWKLDGLGEYDVRRPLTPTGTNLLGLVKHLAGIELEYFGACADRPPATLPPWWHEDEADMVDNEDLWATAEESRELVLGWYRTACAHADETIEALDLGAAIVVPWWPADRTASTLGTVLVHMIAETARHAGHADIVRELVDERAGMYDGVSNMPGDDYDWEAHRARVEAAAREAANR